MKSKQVHELTVAEIGRLTSEFTRQRQECVRELAALFSAAEAGMPEAQPATERAEAVRSRALSIMNGWSPDSIRLPPSTPRRQQLEVERDALDEVLSALSRKELVATAAAAAEFAIEHGDEWTDLCRDIVLCAVRLGALERRAVEWRANLRAAVPSSLPMVQYIGTGRSILGVAWGSDPLSRPREAALQANIVTPKEIEAAENA